MYDTQAYTMTPRVGDFPGGLHPSITPTKAQLSTYVYFTKIPS